MFFALCTASIALSDIVGSARPAGVLFLTRSSQATLSLQVQIKEAALGLRVVSLLDEDYEPDRRVTRVLTYNIYRTSDGANWGWVIQQVMDLAEIIVLDTRECTPNLMMEAGFVLSDGRREKVLALTREDGSVPLLDEFMKQSGDARIQALRRMTEIVLLAEVHRRVLSKFYPKSLQGRHVPIRGEKTNGRFSR